MVIKFSYLLRLLNTDFYNHIFYGAESARFAESIWIPPDRCDYYINPKQFRSFFGSGARRMSGVIVKKWPDHLHQNISQNQAVRYCLAHWVEGQSWQDAGAVDCMLENIARSPKGVSDNCRNEQDVLNRFSALDEAWQAVQEKGRLMTRQEIFPDNFREVGGILMHIGPGGVPVFSGAGCHRFAMALVLGRPFPAQLGCIHISALDSLPSLRLLE